MARFKDFTDKEILLLSKQSLFADVEVYESGKYSDLDQRTHRDLFVELYDEMECRNIEWQ